MQYDRSIGLIQERSEESYLERSIVTECRSKARMNRKGCGSKGMQHEFVWDDESRGSDNPNDLTSGWIIIVDARNGFTYSEQNHTCGRIPIIVGSPCLVRFVVQHEPCSLQLQYVSPGSC